MLHSPYLNISAVNYSAPFTIYTIKNSTNFLKKGDYIANKMDSKFEGKKGPKTKKIMNNGA